MIIGSKRIFFKKLTSTNSYIIKLMSARPLPEGTIVHAGFQSAGKGQKGNQWESEENKNLIFSILLYPSTIHPAEQFYISMTISLGLCDYLERQIEGCKIKWPNDIYIKNDKIAGILIENSIMADEIKYSITGIGLNINQERFTSGALNPVSLKILTGIDYNLNIELDTLSADLDARYNQLINKNFIQIKNDYVSHLYRLNEWSDFSDMSGQFKGRLIAVSDDGKVKIEEDNGRIREYSNNLQFLLNLK
jgi:BirA family transcriptional regulator, biotin operon repressor / biotin---[acetyl-CoA-carboxylase] ligase